jgi:hypothetical protein
MAFFSGRVSFARFRVRGTPPRGFGPKHLEKLADYAMGSQRAHAADGVEIGWTAGDHIFDTDFELEKNIVNDTLHFSLRIDSPRIPADLLRAYYQIELKALSKDNPTGRPSGRQKREAREAAKERLEEEAKDGRYLRRKVVELLWDANSNELLVASPAAAVLDRLLPHFQHTFHHKCDPITAGSLAFDLAEARQQSRAVDDARPSPYVPAQSTGDVAWVPDESSRDFLGNELLLWLWYRCDTEQETIDLSDGSDVAVMPARTLSLECPRAQTGKESISSDGPTRLPEAKRAVQAGKWPRKLGLTLVRHDAQYELTLQAETLAVAGAKLPTLDNEEQRARLEERISQIRHLIETLDLLYDAFGKIRCGNEWTKELDRMQKWLKASE